MVKQVDDPGKAPNSGAGGTKPGTLSNKSKRSDNPLLRGYYVLADLPILAKIFIVVAIGAAIIASL